MLTLIFVAVESLVLSRRLLAVTTLSRLEDPRGAVLEAIARGDRDIEPLIDRLIAVDPSRGRAARFEALNGDWELLWSARTDKFSPLLSLPSPFKPQSQQFLGDGVANTLAKGVLGPTTFVLKAATQVKDDATLEIFPPFKFDVEFNGATRTIVDAPSDAVFRKTQARNRDEQQAPRNLYKQLYLDTSGRPGDLRVSRVVAGDPVIVGATFLHRRIR